MYQNIPPPKKKTRHGTFHAASCGATGSTTQTTLGAVTCHRNSKVLEVKKKMAKKWHPFGRFSESHSETPRLFGCQMNWKISNKKKTWDKETKIDSKFYQNLWEKNPSLPSSHPFLSGSFPTLWIQKNSLEVEHSYLSPFFKTDGWLGVMKLSESLGFCLGQLWKNFGGCDPNHNQKKNPLVGGWTNPSEKYARQIGNQSSPNHFRGDNKDKIEVPPSSPPNFRNKKKRPKTWSLTPPEPHHFLADYKSKNHLYSPPSTPILATFFTYGT